MKATLIYRTRGRWMFWIAFACAAAIHVAAIAMAKNKAEKTTVENFKPPGPDIEVLDVQVEQPAPEEAITIPPPAPLPLQEEIFAEENRTLPPIHSRTKIRVASFIRRTRAAFGSVKESVMYAPRPAYPYEARRQRVTGSGIALLTADPAAGNVTNARMKQSCGNAILDNATLEAFRRWRFKPGSALVIEVPITYTLTGASH